MTAALVLSENLADATQSAKKTRLLLTDTSNGGSVESFMRLSFIPLALSARGLTISETSSY